MKSKTHKAAGKASLDPMVRLAKRLWTIGKNTKFRELRKRGVPFLTVAWDDLGPAGQTAWVAVAREVNRLAKANAKVEFQEWSEE